MAGTPIDRRGARGASLALLFVSLGLVTLLSQLNTTVFTPALPVLVADLDGLGEMPWVIAAYMLASIPTMPIYGRLSDALGRRPLLLFAIAAFVIGSVIGAVAPDMSWLIAGRVVQGIGSGGLTVLPAAALADILPARRRGFYAGILAAVSTLASLLGPFIGGVLAQGPGWRSTFWLNVALGVVASIGVLTLLRIPRRPSPASLRIDVWGMALISIATTSLALTVVWGGSAYAWDSAMMLGLIAVCLAAIIIFVVVERRARHPILPVELFRDRNFVLTSAASIGIGMQMFATIAYLPSYLQMVFGASPAEAGLLMIPMSGGTLLASTLTGQLISHTGRYKIYPILGTLLIAVGMIGLSSMTPDSSLVWICGSVGLIGLGLGGCFQNLILIVQNSFPHGIVGVATAGSSLFRQIGGMVGTSLAGTVFVGGLTRNLDDRLPAVARAAIGDSPSPDAVAALPADLGELVIASYNDALTPVYALMVPIALAAALALCLVRAEPLAETID
ncbi:MFS transporter [Leucobacter weissii]|uniref:MFS transporter n=1 Tax=Leucobacter weissii TaxID=1983706 RepID=A0A939S7T2_9MICO|nr:MFS transporter [Leucobacter weissii]MBO1901316.1 MFS transporter [Leucobacter weissii]